MRITLLGSSLALALALLGCDAVTAPAPLFVMMDDAGGVRPGAPVYMAGVQVGRVLTVQLEGGRARVEFAMGDEPKVVLHQDSCVSVGHYGMAADAHLSVDPGTESSPVVDRGELTCVRALTKTQKSAERSLASVEKLLEQATSGKGTIARLLSDEALADRVARFFEQNAAPPVAPSDADAPPPPGPGGAADEPPAPGTPKAPLTSAPATVPPAASPKKPPPGAGVVNPQQ